MSEYSLSIEPNQANYMYSSEFAKQFVANELIDSLRLSDSETIAWIYEEIIEDDDAHDTPSNIYHLFVISFDSTSNLYTYRLFFAEEWFSPFEIVEFFEAHAETKDQFFPITKWMEFKWFFGID
jgi:hypothetical protein